MALPLFNGVVKSGCGEKCPFFFQRGVSECDCIKSRFPCRDVQTFVLWSFGKNMTADSYQLSFFQLTNRIVGHAEGQRLRNNPLFTYGSCVAEPQTLLMLDGPSC